ncbi:unnamed protein product [Dovyalis caffra]|uniref:Uncharacterized protein n=1 Tax=Dovyalis caffra TaxID=77055 RepID=A0AAV1RZ39_9ROSI|nr:unnamed protein product [Dovyalis caffra]
MMGEKVIGLLLMVATVAHSATLCLVLSCCGDCYKVRHRRAATDMKEKQQVYIYDHSPGSTWAENSFDTTPSSS